MPLSTSNFLQSLPEHVRSRLLSRCKKVELVLAMVLDDASRLTSHVYFPIEGFVSSIVVIDGQPTTEVGMVGREGIVGCAVALGILRSPVHCLVQGGGQAWRISVSDFRSEVRHSELLKERVDRYLYVLLVQYSRAAGCLSAHRLGPRLARWLLMTHDHAGSADFDITQEFLAYMLGARRETVTKAAISFQESGLIEYRRGQMSILDRDALEAEACECYAADRRSYLDAMH